MKVFISWSGLLSRQVALAFRDWLPLIIQTIEPFVSDEDIGKGQLWMTVLQRELTGAGFGIVCLTRSNIGAPWLNFEAGVLSRALNRSDVHEEERRVAPFLFNLDKAELLKSPLSSFQMTTNDEPGIKQLLASCNASSEHPLSDGILADTFAQWWPKLKQRLDDIASNSAAIEPQEMSAPKVEIDDVIKEILSEIRDQQRLLSSPESLIPRSYLESIIRAVLPPTYASPVTLLGGVEDSSRVGGLSASYMPTFADRRPELGRDVIASAVPTAHYAPNSSTLMPSSRNFSLDISCQQCGQNFNPIGAFLASKAGFVKCPACQHEQQWPTLSQENQ